MPALSVAFDISHPAGTEFKRLGDNRIREFKVQLQEWAQTDHSFPATASTGSADTGWHKWITHFKQASSPSAVTDGIRTFSKDDSLGNLEWFFLDESGNEHQLTSLGKFIGGGFKEVKMTYGTVAEIATKWPGWQLCNGTNGTPDLRDQFIAGVKQDDSGTPKTNITGSLTQSGGAATKDISHTHGVGSFSVPNHTHTVPASSTGWGATGATSGKLTTGQDGGTSATTDKATSSSGSSSVSGTSASSGSSTQDVMNPYYALCYIAQPTS